MNGSNSVISFEPNDYPKDYGSGYLWFMRRAGEIIPPWGMPGRDGFLRRLRVNPYNTVVAGALNNLIATTQQTDWEMVGGRNNARYAQSLLQDAHFGEGWDAFLDRLLQDLFYTDKGAFIEIEAPGRSDSPRTRRATRLNVLDSLRCYVTGNAEYPVWYEDHITGAMVKLHASRVHRLTRLPSSNPTHLGRGICLMSSAIGVANAQMLILQYINEKLDDLPPNAIYTVSGIRMEQFQQAMRRHFANQSANGADVFGNIAAVGGVDPQASVSVNLVPFSTVPEGFDYEVYMRQHVYTLALAIGVDPQDIWPLTGAALGTGEQSRVLNAKGKAKTQGQLYKLITRMLNVHDILPADTEFRFKPNDTEQSQVEADTAKTWAGVTVEAVGNGLLTVDEGRLLMSNTVAAFRDVLLDAQGQIRRPDDDVIEDDDTITEDDGADETPDMAATVEAEQRVYDLADFDYHLPAFRRYRAALYEQVTAAASKNIRATETDFQAEFLDFLGQASAGNLNRRRAGIVLRALVSRFGRRAYDDGLRVGGVLPEDKSDDDLATIRRLTGDASQYVTDMLNALYRDGLTREQLANKPDLWWNKTITPFYEAALESADRNGYYEWVYNPQKENCRDCRRLNGQIHRLRDWIRSGWRPKSSRLACGGWQCGCEWVKRAGVRARGRF